MACNVGSEKLHEYTAIGYTTNTATRIESLTKGTPHMIMLSESTSMMKLGESPELQRIDSMGVKGRREEVVIWAPVETADEALASPAG
jgi:class 3 adenylate cyclase